MTSVIDGCDAVDGSDNEDVLSIIGGNLDDLNSNSSSTEDSDNWAQARIEASAPPCPTFTPRSPSPPAQQRLAVDCSEQSSSSQRSSCSPLGLQSVVTSSTSKKEKHFLQTEGLLPSSSLPLSQPFAIIKSNDAEHPETHSLFEKQTFTPNDVGKSKPSKPSSPRNIKPRNCVLTAPKNVKSVVRRGVNFSDATVMSDIAVGHGTNKEGGLHHRKRYFDDSHKHYIPRKRKQESGRDSGLGDRAKFVGYQDRHRRVIKDPRLHTGVAQKDHRVMDHDHTMSGVTMRPLLPPGSCYQLYCTGVCMNTACHFSHQVPVDVVEQFAGDIILNNLCPEWTGNTSSNSHSPYTRPTAPVNSERPASGSEDNAKPFIHPRLPPGTSVWALLDRLIFLHPDRPLLALAALRPLARYLASAPASAAANVLVPSQFAFVLDCARICELCEDPALQAAAKRRGLVAAGPAYLLLRKTFPHLSEHSQRRVVLAFLPLCAPVAGDLNGHGLRAPSEMLLSAGLETDPHQHDDLLSALDISWIRGYIASDDAGAVSSVYGHLTKTLTSGSNFFTIITLEFLSFHRSRGLWGEAYRALPVLRRLRVSDPALYLLLLPDLPTAVTTGSSPGPTLILLLELIDVIIEREVTLLPQQWTELLSVLVGKSSSSATASLFHPPTAASSPYSLVTMGHSSSASSACWLQTAPSAADADHRALERAADVMVVAVRLCPLFTPPPPLLASLLHGLSSTPLLLTPLQRLCCALPPPLLHVCAALLHRTLLRVRAMPPPAPRTEQAIREWLAKAGINLNYGDSKVDTNKPGQVNVVAGEKETVTASGLNLGENRSNCQDTPNDAVVIQWPGQSQKAENEAPLDRSRSDRSSPGERVSQVFLADNDMKVSFCTDFDSSSQDTNEGKSTGMKNVRPTLDNALGPHSQLGAKQCLMRNITKFFKARIDQINHSNQDCTTIPVTADPEMTTLDAKYFERSNLSSGASDSIKIAGSDSSGSGDPPPASPRTTPLDGSDQTTQTVPRDPRIGTEHSSSAGVERYAPASFPHVQSDGLFSVPALSKLVVLDGGTPGTKIDFSMSQSAHSTLVSPTDMTNLCDAVPSSTVADHALAPERYSPEKQCTADQQLMPITSTSGTPTMSGNIRQRLNTHSDEIHKSTVSGSVLGLTPKPIQTSAVRGTSAKCNASSGRGNALLNNAAAAALQTVVMLDSNLSDASCPVSDASCLVSDASCSVSDASCSVSDASCPVSDASCPVSDASCPVSDASCSVSDASCPVSDSHLFRTAKVPDADLAVDTLGYVGTQHSYSCPVSASSSGYCSNSCTPANDSACPYIIPVSDSVKPLRVVYFPDLCVCDYIEETEVEIVPTRSINPSLLSRLGNISPPSQEIANFPSLPGNKMYPITKSVVTRGTLTSPLNDASSDQLIPCRQTAFPTKPLNANSRRGFWCTGVSERLQPLPTITPQMTLSSADSERNAKRRVIVHPRIVATSASVSGTTSTVACNKNDPIPDQPERNFHKLETSYSFNGTHNKTTHPLLRGSDLAGVAEPSLAPSSLKRSQPLGPHSSRKVTLLTVSRANSRPGKHSSRADVHRRALESTSYVSDVTRTSSKDRMAPYNLSQGQKNYKDTVSEIYEEISEHASTAMEDIMDATVRKPYDTQLAETYVPAENHPESELSAFSHDPGAIVGQHPPISLTSTKRINQDRDLHFPTSSSLRVHQGHLVHEGEDAIVNSDDNYPTYTDTVFTDEDSNIYSSYTGSPRNFEPHAIREHSGEQIHEISPSDSHTTFSRSYSESVNPCWSTEVLYRRPSSVAQQHHLALPPVLHGNRGTNVPSSRTGHPWH